MLGATSLAVLALGWLDVAQSGGAFSVSEALGTVLLWWLFLLPGAVAVSLGVLVVVLLLSRGGSPAVVAVVTIWATFQVAVLVAIQQQLWSVPVAAVGSVLLAAWAVRRGRRGAGPPQVSGPWLAGLGLLPLASFAPLCPGRLAALAAILLAVACGAVGGLLAPRLGRWSRWSLAAVLALGSLALGRAGGTAERGPRATPSDARPAVILIVLDTQRADYLGPYSDGASLSPQLDRVAREGVVFERAFASASWTVPSHASLFTGLPPRTHGCSFRHHRHLDDSFTTLAEALREAKYQTAGFCANEYVRLAHLDQGFEVFREPGARFRSLLLRRWAQLLGFPARWCDQGAADAVAMVERFLRSERDSDRPLFLFVNLLEPHWRYLPVLEERWNALPGGVDLLTASRIASQLYGPLMMAGKHIDGPADEVLRAFYAAAVAYQDRQLGHLLEVLREHLDLDQALLMITADHGENLGEGGRYDHVFALNDHLIHVPLVVRHPAGFPAGSRRADLVQILDVPATVQDLVPGVVLPPNGGHSLRARLPGRDHVVAEGDPYLGHLERMSKYTGMRRDVARYATFLEAVRDLRYKYVRTSAGEEFLYDLETDPDETRNLLLRLPEAAEPYRRRLEEWLEATAKYEPPADSGHETLSDEERSSLESLGYMGDR